MCRLGHSEIDAKTNSRSHVGTLNDFIGLLCWQLQGQADPDLVQAAIELAQTPVAAATRRRSSPTSSRGSC